MNYLHLEKAYPEFKIPAKKYAEYYVETLINSCYVSRQPLEDLKDFEENSTVSISDYKHEKMWEIIKYLKTYNCDEKIPEHNYKTLEFNDYKYGKYYVSIDLKQANWQSFKFLNKIPFENSWEDFCKKFELHSFLVNSKSFRQFIFGNLNPKLFQKVQMYLISNIESIISENYQENIIGRKTDEIILEFPNIKEAGYFYDYFTEKEISNAKISFFKIANVISFEENVKVKTNLVLGNKTLFQVSGNRFFIHFKNLILKEIPNSNDKSFEMDKFFIAQWQI